MKGSGGEGGTILSHSQKESNPLIKIRGYHMIGNNCFRWLWLPRCQFLQLRNIIQACEQTPDDVYGGLQSVYVIVLSYFTARPLSACFHHCVTKGRLPSNANLIELMWWWVGIEYRTRHTHKNGSGTTRCKEFPQFNRFYILSTCRHNTGSV